MNANDFIPLIKKPDDAPDVVKLLKDLGVTKKPKLPKGDMYAFVKFPEDGFVLAFRESEDAKTSQLVLAAVQFYSDDEPGFSTFKGELPNGIQFSDDRSNVKKKLGKPTRSKDFLRKDFWDRSGYVVTVRYRKGAEGIQSVSLDMPMSS